MKEPDIFDRLEAFWGELVRRRVVHVAGVYAIVSWIVVYMVATTYETLFLPGAVFQTLVALTFLGFPVLLVLAWYFGLGRGGVRFRRVGGAVLYALVRMGEGERALTLGQDRGASSDGLFLASGVWAVWGQELRRLPACTEFRATYRHGRAVGPARPARFLPAGGAARICM